MRPGRPFAMKPLLSRASAVVCACGALWMSAPAHAQLFPDNDARKAILELREKTAADQKENAARLDRLEQQNARNQLDLMQQLDALRAELARLRGQLEVTQKDLADVQKRQSETYADLDQRLKRSEPQKVVVDGKEASVEPEEQRQYNAAFEQFRASQFAPAAQAFTQFLRAYPQSAYAPLAQFWLGNAQYASRDFKGAITTHREFVRANPDSPRAGDALLNIGNSQLELNDKVGARKTFREIADKYPGTPAAQNAKERLATLK